MNEGLAPVTTLQAKPKHAEAQASGGNDNSHSLHMMQHTKQCTRNNAYSENRAAASRSYDSELNSHRQRF